MDISLVTKDISLTKNISEEEISKLTELILSYLEQDNLTELTIMLVNDTYIHGINKKYRNKDNPTDVISFVNNPEVIIPNKYLGDIIISLDTAEKQAEEQKVELIEEITRLLTHGILHLIGYEHENVSINIANKMFDKQEEIIKNVRSKRN